MTKICLDTDVVLDFLKGHKASVAKIRHYVDNDELSITSLTFFELVSAIKKKGRVLPILDNLTLLPFEKKAALRANRIHESIQAQKMEIGMRELINSAICIENEAWLYTKNRSTYDGVEGLKFI
ncbi:MAG: type II toxin-antitoxin system VapC family toxin [Candidatus Micrarchaeia archaeon]|jgi:predicted nucleic acid-binding protein